MWWFLTEARFNGLVDQEIERRETLATIHKRDTEDREARAKELLEAWEGLTRYVPGQACSICGAPNPEPRLIDGRQRMDMGGGQLVVVAGSTPTYGFHDRPTRRPRFYVAVNCSVCNGAQNMTPAGREKTRKAKAKARPKKK